MHHKYWWKINRWCWRFIFSYTNVQSYKNSSNYTGIRESSLFYSKDEATDFNAGISRDHPNSNQANEILRNTTIVVPLKNLSSFCEITWNAID